MRRLADLSEGRDNNLNLIRLVAAQAVLVSHAYPITLGGGTPEPLYHLTGHSLGTIAVYIFFAISGFLITASFQRSSSRTSFVAARTLRLMPGLVISLLLVALVLGPLVTSLPLDAYFAGAAPLEFIFRNTALFPLVFELPGVYQDQPFKGVVGSIWTLRHEVLCYAGVFVAGVLGLWQTRWRAGVCLAIYLAVWAAVLWFEPPLPGLLVTFLRLSMPFAIGIAFWIWRDRIPLGLAPLAILAVLAWLGRDTMLSLPLFSLALTYGTFWLGYVPGGAIRKFNRLGDYSYGVYVYAFPLQGLAVHLFGDQTPVQNMLLSTPPTLILAIASWHLIEGPAMAAKPRLLRALGRVGPRMSSRTDPKGPPGDPQFPPRR